MILLFCCARICGLGAVVRIGGNRLEAGEHSSPLRNRADLHPVHPPRTRAGWVLKWLIVTLHSAVDIWDFLLLHLHI